MAQRSSSEQRERRRDARERRRSLAAEPFEQADEAAKKAEQRTGSGKRSDALKQAAATAVAGAVAAGIAGAAKAIRDRPNNVEDRGPGSDGGDDDPDAEQKEAAATAEPDEHQARSAPESVEGGGGDGTDDDGGGGGGGGGGDRPDDDAPRGQKEAEPEEDQVAGAATGEARKIVEQARRELEELLGAEPESVSGFERSNGRWTVTLEVVDMHRIPESTDVLASYEVVFDDDRNLVNVTQKRRYRRSQVEEGR